MRVVQFGPYPPPHGGVASNVVAIHRALRARGIDAHVVTITRAAASDSPGVHYPKGVPGVLAMMMSRTPDVIHIHLGGRITARLLALCLVSSLIPRARSVLTFHSGGFATSAAGLRAKKLSAIGYIFRRLDRIIAVSQEIAELFQRFGVPGERIRVIAPHAVDVSEVGEPGDRSLLPDSIKMFLSTHSPVLVSVGCLEPEYELEFQLASLPRIREAFPNAGLMVVGSGSLQDQLSTRIALSPEREHALLCGDVPHAVTLRIILAADALLRTTRYDGDSIAVREAIALGTPVVATDRAARPRGVQLFALGDPVGFCNAVKNAIGGGRLPPSVADGGSVEPVIALYGELVGGEIDTDQSAHGPTEDRHSESAA